MEKIRLGAAATYVNGYAFKPSDWCEDGLPIIRIQDLNGTSYHLNYYEGDYPKKIEINNGDILISWSASLGIYIWDRGKALLNQHIFKVIFDKVCIDRKYFVYAVKYKLKEMESKTHGATMKHIVKKDFDNILIPYPNKKKQHEIASFLNKIDEIIEMRKQQLELLDNLIKARFVEMFGDLKKNDMGWQVCSFSDFAQIDTTMIHDFEKYGDYPHIGIDSIEKESGNISGYRTVREDGVVSGKYLFTPEHIIYSKIRPNLNKVALPEFKGVCSADAYPILPKKEKCNRIFLAYTMRSSMFLEYILAFSSRTNLPKVNKLQVEGFCCPIPDIALQEQFAAFAYQVDKSKVAIQKSLNETQLLFDSLMQKYFG